MATATATATATSPGPGGLPATPAASLVPTPGTALAKPPGTNGDPSTPGSGLMRVVAGALPVRVQDVLAQPAVRRALPAIVFLLLAFLFWLVYSWMQATPYRPLMTGLSEADRQAALEALRTADFSPRIDKSTGQLTVPLDRYHEARMYLASQGLPKTGATGLDGLKDQSSMTTSQFMEQVRVNAAIEQELARSIMQIGSVQSARVHLATPKQSVFVRDRTPPKASVVVAPHPGRVVSPSQVQAIVHLVSSSVPYLAPEHVTVVDTVGHLMTETAAELKLGLTSAQTQHKQQLEELYRARILQILSPVVGEANVRSQVNLVMDFTQVESTTEDYDARDKGPKTRSEVLSEDRAARRDASGIPGALSNTPPAEATATTTTAADSAKGKSESSDTVSSRTTRNYELDRNVRHVKNAAGVIQRLSVAVVVNERATTAGKPAEGQTEEAPASGYSAQELERLQELVRGVVGFDNARGDSVTVVPARFEAAPPLAESPWYLEDKVHYGLRTGLLGLAFIVFLLVVVRPLMRSLTGADDKQGAQDDAAAPLADGELSEEEMRMIQIGEGESLEQIKAKLKPKKSLISADMLDTANTYDDKVALIRMLVAEDSGRVASVLKGMIRSGK
jgi:flagellar M-ring protein FliF